jgi:hypothetical protein
MRLPVNASFTQELIAIGAVLAVLLLGLFAVWAADEMADSVVAVAVAIVYVLGLISHGRHHRNPWQRRSGQADKIRASVTRRFVCIARPDLGGRA